MRVMLEDCWDYMSADGVGSGQVSPVMTEAEKQAKDKDKMAASKEGDSGKKKIKKDLWENWLWQPLKTGARMILFINMLWHSNVKKTYGAFT